MTNTKPTRIHPELDRILNNAIARRLLRGESVSRTRITLAIARQYKKYPNLLKELEDAELKR